MEPLYQNENMPPTSSSVIYEIVYYVFGGLLGVIVMFIRYEWLKKDKEAADYEEALKDFSKTLQSIKSNSDRIPDIERKVDAHSDKISSLQQWKSGIEEWKKSIDRDKN